MVVKFIVDAHKEKISIEIKPQRGSLFVVTLPLATT